MADSLPSRQARPSHDPFEVSERAADYVTVTSSARSAGEPSVPAPVRKAPLAFAGIRHRLESEEASKGGHAERQMVGQCSQAVMISCLHLSHEQAHNLGRFAWTLPSIKEPAESTLRIMKRYADQIVELTPEHKMDVRKAPDPSRNVIQHHMLKARETAGLDSYVVVFYGGHGIQEPPTDAGELWCYDKSFEQCIETGSGPSEYIPVLLFDFFSWCGSSTCYVWDCQKAGRFLKAAVAEAAEVDSQLRRAGETDPQVARLHPPVYSKRQIHFAACGPEEALPHVPGLPDDLFISCLQTPLRVALLYHNSQTFPLMATHQDRAFSQRAAPYMEALYHSMSKDLKGRLWKEMQALLSTIAWHVLEADQYQFLFGQHGGDLISNLACGFLLSQRVMSTYHATPESLPHIPWSTSHSLWTTWDLMLDSFFEQLPPYFDEDVLDYSWEKDLRLVSFIGDQLQGVFTPDLGTESTSDPIAVTGLSRIPIMCSAALFPEHQQLACEALATCLRSLNLRDLAKAVQGGALDVAFQLLGAENHHGLAPQLISIWASLVRDPTAIALLATGASTVERLTNLSTIQFFLSHLDENVSRPDEQGNKQIIIQSAVVLATIATNVGERTAPHFVSQALALTGQMLRHTDGLVQQWGALLLAELNAGIQGSLQDEANDELKPLLTSLVKDRSVDTRATAVYALARGVPIHTVKDIMELGEAILLTTALLPLAQADGSPIVRKEIVGLTRRILTNAGCWTTLVLLIYSLQLAMVQLPEHLDTCVEVMKDVGDTIKLRPEQRRLLCKLEQIFKEVSVVQHDPDSRVVKVTYALICRMMGVLRSFMSDADHELVFAATFPAADAQPLWTPRLVEVMKGAIEKLAKSWEELIGQPSELVAGATNNDLFETSRMSLQEHLSRHEERLLETPDEASTTKSEPGPSERTYILRHRALEDAMVVAEQQVGLPWKWHMKDITPADPWTTIACHSFDSILLACDDSHNVVFWDWGLNRKTGDIKLILAPQQRVTSARFVNELHPSNIVLAEISNGVMHVLSGETHDPDGMRSISSFLALDVMRHNLAVPPTPRERGILSSSWWRQTGRLVVGGASEDINVWDCPAERCVKTLKTRSDHMITRVIHEPISGNIIITGYENGEVKLFDLRQNRATSLLEWDGSTTLPGVTMTSRNIRKIGMALGVSSHVSSAAANGMINIHDLRKLSEPIVTVHAQPHGIASASFQAHSGLMSTLSNLHPSPNGGKPKSTFGMYRIISNMTTVTVDDIEFDVPPSNVVTDRWGPYAVMHPLRPWVGLGFGSTCRLRASGVGHGDDTDSGSYTFLKSQEKFAITTSI